MTYIPAGPDTPRIFQLICYGLIDVRACSSSTTFAWLYTIDLAIPHHLSLLLG